MKTEKKNQTYNIVTVIRYANINSVLLVFLIATAFISCKKFIEVDAPSTSTTTDLVYSSDTKAIAAMTGIYAQMSSNSFNGNGFLSLSLSPELSGDNLGLFSNSNAEYISYYKNALNAQYNGGAINNLWVKLYSIIYQSNAVLEGVDKSTKLSFNVKKQLIGEAYFVRALCYFYLTNLYHDVPLALTTDYAITAILSRAPQGNVYGQIISDLKAAKEVINDHYLDSKLSGATEERLRPNKFAVCALLARAYLFSGDYPNAEIQSNEVIHNVSDYKLENLNQVFLKTSKETIWSIQPTDIGQNTAEAQFYYLRATGPSSVQPVYLSPMLIGSFEPHDQRKSDWVSQVTAGGIEFNFSAKYKVVEYNAPVTEYSVVLRLAEQYLIRAESRVMQNKLSEAMDDVRAIRIRAGLGESSASTRDELLAAILQERRVEFFTEWGTRWFDLKRTGQINQQMQIAATFKGGTWDPNAQLYPVPQFDRTKNPNLTQNLGY